MIAKYKKRKLFIAIIVVLITMLILAFYCNIVVKTDCKTAIGIIDTDLTKCYDNIIYSSENIIAANKKTHGDLLLQFLENCQDNLQIYYFNACYDNKKINSKKIIEGLEWMSQHNVKRVNISLSSKRQNDELREWLLVHKDIKIFASYNNRLNSADYPAMYNTVIGSGSDNRIKYKSIDIGYKSDKIITLHKGIHYYKGNSFLSVLSMLEYDMNYNN